MPLEQEIAVCHAGFLSRFKALNGGPTSLCLGSGRADTALVGGTARPPVHDWPPSIIEILPVMCEDLGEQR